MLTFLTILILAVLAVFMPRTILAITGGIIVGGAWWILFAPLTAIAAVIDILDLAMSPLNPDIWLRRR